MHSASNQTPSGGDGLQVTLASARRWFCSPPWCASALPLGVRPVWVPDGAHEALRDLVRVRETAKEDQLALPVTIRLAAAPAPLMIAALLKHVLPTTVK